MIQAVRPMPDEMPAELWCGLDRRVAWPGDLVGIFIAPESAADMVSLPKVRAFADRGLEGDRFLRDSWSAVNRPDKAVSLIEDEVLRLAAAELGHESIAGLSRRNLVTRGVPLIELLHREFIIGKVRMRGVRLFEPCGHLVKVTGLPGIFKALHHRSGLKAAILSDGVLRIGDRVALEPSTVTDAGVGLGR